MSALSHPAPHRDEASPTAASASRSLRRVVARAALLVWMPTVALGVGSLMVSHWAPLPEPEVSAESPLSIALADLTQGVPEVAPSWSLVHVLYESCGCSRRVLNHLLDDERPVDVPEWILLVQNEEGEVDSSLDDAAAQRGFHVSRLSPELLGSRYGIAAAPLFVALDPTGTIRFCGGYTDRKQGLDFLDQDVLRQLRAGATPDPIPVYGCGVSRSLQAALDPFLLKY